MKKFSFLSSLLCLIILLVGCSHNLKDQKTSSTTKPDSKFFLGTIINLDIYDKPSDKIYSDAYKRIEDLEKKMSLNISTSELNKINSQAGIGYVKVSKDTYDVIEKSLKYSELSNGKFDISIGPLVKTWGIGSDHAKVPTQTEIDSLLPLINYKNILLNSEDHSVMLKEKGMILDLGAIAKGYVADEIAKTIKENGSSSAIINLGGNVLAVGGKDKNTPWKIGIQNPFSQRGEYIGIASVRDKSIVTSGIYERFFKKNGVIYHHILDTHTGYPSDNNLEGVSIISDYSIDGDALSTSVFTLGVDDGMKLINSLPGVDAIFITKDKKVYLTDGVKKIFQLTDSTFTISN